MNTNAFRVEQEIFVLRNEINKIDNIVKSATMNEDRVEMYLDKKKLLEFELNKRLSVCNFEFSDAQPKRNEKKVFVLRKQHN